MRKIVGFPQPMIEAPEYGARYWIVYGNGEISDLLWDDDEYDRAYLDAGSVYATKAGAEQRLAYSAQEMLRLVMPAWFRKLGPDVEFQSAPDKWEAVDLSGRDWSQEKPENYRAKVRAVVRTVEGKEYRWPATVREFEPAGERYQVTLDGVVFYGRANMYGPFIHHTREGAEQQFASIKAAAGL